MLKPVLSWVSHALMPDVRERRLFLTDEQYQALRASAYLQGKRTSHLLREIVDEGLGRLQEDSAVRKLVRIQRSGLSVV